MVIETFDLTKQYKGKGGCINIRLNVEKGKVFGFLGPNGAGKSTLIKTLLGLLIPTSGSAWILGKPLGNIEVKKRIGYLPENFKYHDWMTGLEVMKFHSELYRLENNNKRISELMELVKLNGHEKKRVRGYSKGMQQRLGLAVALLPSPDILFLDEPTSALDPVGRIEVREIIQNLKDEGKTVFLNSHLLSEVERVCDEVAIINKGRIVAQGSLSDMLCKGTRVEVKIGTPSKNLVDNLSKIGSHIEIRDNILCLKVESHEDIPHIAKIIVESKTPLYELHTNTSSLEQLFVNLMKRGELHDIHNQTHFSGDV